MSQSTLKTTIHNLWPKLLVIVAGFGLYGLAVTWLQGDFKSLVIGIGGGLVSIPLAFIFYEIWQEKSHRKLNNSVYEFAENQMQVSIRAVKSKLELLVAGASHTSRVAGSWLTMKTLRTSKSMFRKMKAKT